MNHATNREAVVDLVKKLRDPKLEKEAQAIRSMSLEEDAKQRTLDFYFRRMSVAEQTDAAIAKIDKELLRRMDDPNEGLTTAQLLKYRSDLAMARNADTKVVLDPLKPAPNGGTLISSNAPSENQAPKEILGAEQSEIIEKAFRGIVAATEKAAMEKAQNVTKKDV